IEDSQCVQTILRNECVPHISAAEGNGTDAPARITGEQRVHEPRLMNAMKRTRSEVHDADVDLAAIVARPPHLTRNTSQVGLREKLGHYRTTPVFQMEISRSSLSSLRAGLPEAVSMINCMSLAVASSRLVPSRSWPASKSIQRGFFCASAELE